MRIHGISDIHIDYEANLEWLNALSSEDFTEDILILAGDMTHDIQALATALTTLRPKFKEILFVTGNHDLWVSPKESGNSLDKFDSISNILQDLSIKSSPLSFPKVKIVPLQSWYDFSFGYPSKDIQERWMDFHTCKWPENFDEPAITQYFINMNLPFLKKNNDSECTVITFSHFMPRIDIMPSFLPPHVKALYPVMGSLRIENQLRQLNANIHIYGHSHLNIEKTIEGTTYINNAFGYPKETRICRKELLSIWED